MSEPDLFIPDFSLGRDLQVPVTATLASRLPAPTSNLTINICEYGGIYLSPNSTTSPLDQCISSTIPTGQHVSTPFYVGALGFSDTTQLRVSSPTLTPSSSNVSLTRTAFTFREASQTQPLSVTRGTALKLTIAPALFPLTTTSIAPPAIRAGVMPITVNVVSSDPKIVMVTNSPVTFKPGDQQATITVQPLAPGTATLTLSGATYEFGTTQSSVSLQVK